MRRPIVFIVVLFLTGLAIWYTLHPPCSLHREVEEDVELTGTVESVRRSPTSFCIILSGVTCKKVSCKSVIAYTKNLPPSIKSGNRIFLSGTLSSFSLPGNPGQFNEFLYYQQQNIDYRLFAEDIKVLDTTTSFWGEVLDRFRNNLCYQIDQALPKREAGILKAMLFGEKSGLTEEVRDQYRENGIAHLLAISGLHVSIIGVGLFNFLRKYACRMQTAAGITIVFIMFYGEITGFGVATCRAVVMMLFMLCARLVGRAYDALTAMAVSALIILVPNPLNLFAMSFQLSYGTSLGICFAMPIVKEWTKRESRGIQAIAAAAGTFLVNIPLCLYYFGEVVTYSILVNTFIIPVIAYLVGIGLIASVVSIVLPFCRVIFFSLVHWSFVYMDLVLRGVSYFPYSIVILGHISWPRIIIYLACLVTTLRIKKWWPICGMVVILLVPVKSPPMELTFLDVGQGDCIFGSVQGTNFLIDCGSSTVDEVAKYRLVPFLKWKGIARLDYVFITHGDGDHTNGVLELLDSAKQNGIVIKTVVLRGKDVEGSKELNQIEVACHKNNVPITYLSQGQKMKWKDAIITCLNPRKELTTEEENNRSLVLDFQFGKFRALFTGDIEIEGEKEFLSSVSHVDVLKVAHHGSKGASSEQLLQILSPRVSIISAGKKNRYGHPNPETLRRIRKEESQIYTTISSGAITVTGDGASYVVSTWR